MNKVLAVALVGTVLGGCASVGAGTSNVTCQTMKFVYLSRKDTPKTIQQVAGNNAAWISVCGSPPPQR